MDAIEFDRKQFDSFMAVAGSHHEHGDYKKAIYFSTEAYGMAPAGSTDQGRAARNNSAHYDRLSLFDDAEIWADEAFNTHDEIVEEMGDNPSREVLRERSVSAMYVAVSGLRKVIKGRQNFEPDDSAKAVSRKMMKQTRSDIKAANKQATGINRFIDQYKINAARRVSIEESVDGSKFKGFIFGLEALALGFFSQAKFLDTSDPNKDIIQRLEAKIKAVGGAVMALEVNVLLIATKEPKLRALELADKAL